jgi:hypothetical protein
MYKGRMISGSMMAMQSFMKIHEVVKKLLMVDSLMDMIYQLTLFLNRLETSTITFAARSSFFL